MISLVAVLAALFTVLFVSPVAAQGGIKPTNEWVTFYGVSCTLNGAPLPIGATITAYDPSGVLCGQFVVHTAGSYGVMPVYRDDPMTADDEGAQPGDVISFKINGQSATVAGPDTPTWTSNGALIHIELSAGSATGPTATRPPAATATATTPAVVASPTPGGGSSPEWVNFYGTSSTLDGGPLPAGAVVEAWSADGTRCGAFTVTTAGSYGVLACQRSAPGSTGMQPGGTVYFTINGRAALPLGPDAATWTSNGDRRRVELEVPPLTPVATAIPSATATTVAGSSPEWVNFYGTASTLNGAPIPVGAVVQAFAQDGTPCGSFTVTTAGSYGVLACQRATAGAPGAGPGQTISFRINGTAATAMGPDTPTWTAHGDRRHVELNATVSAATPTATSPAPVPTATATVPGPVPSATATRPGPAPSATATSGPEAPQWVNFYGTASIYEGAPLPIGAVVVAWSPGGVQCGSFTVTAVGSYGLLACMGAPVGLPGAHPGDTIYFTINGRAALTTGPDAPTWTTHGDRRHVELQIPAPTATPVGPTATSTSVSPTTPTATPVGPTATRTRTPAPGTATPTPASGPCTGITYSVKWGDYLYKIARQFGVSAADIMRCNVLPNPNLLRPGQQLLIPQGGPGPVTPVPSRTVVPPTPTPQPCGTRYYVRPGDTLSRIALMFGTTVRAIMDANGLVNPNYIYVGQVLWIPCGGGSVTPTPAPPGPLCYVVRYGDTLSGIAARFGVNMYRLAVANNLYYPYIIYVGQRLTIVP
jgi:LysM repeat protein